VRLLSPILLRSTAPDERDHDMYTHFISEWKQEFDPALRSRQLAEKATSREATADGYGDSGS